MAVSIDGGWLKQVQAEDETVNASSLIKDALEDLFNSGQSMHDTVQLRLHGWKYQDKSAQS